MPTFLFRTSATSTLFLLAVFMAGFVGGCTKGMKPFAGMAMPATQPASYRDPARVSDDLMDFADNYVNTIVVSFTQLERKSPRAAQKRTAQALRLAAAKGAYIDATDDNPLAGLVNIVVLVDLQKQTADQAWFSDYFGKENADEVRAVLAGQCTRVWELAALYLTQSQIDELRVAIARWLEENPTIHVVALIRLSDFRQAKEAKARNMPGSVFSLLFIDPFASLDPAIREVQETRITANRMFFYIQRMPDLLRWEAELLYSDVLTAPELASVFESTATFAANTTEFNKVCKEFADTIAKFPADITVEREKTVVQLTAAVAQQRDAAVVQIAEATSKEREAAVKQVASATDAAINQIAAATSQERKAALDQVASITDSTIKQATASLTELQKKTLADTDSTATDFLNRLTARLILVAFVAAAALALALLGYRFIANRMGLK